MKAFGARHLAIGSLIMLALLGGCSEDSSFDDGVHENGSGFLASPDGITSSIHSPDRRQWTATFGAVLPCASGSETPVIDAVRYDFAVKPVDVRTVYFAATSSRLTFGTARGAPEKLRDGHPQGVPGTIVGDVAGVEIVGRCSERPNTDIQQFLTVLEVDERGAAIDRYYIDYHTESGHYTLKADYRMVACGTETPRSLCSPDATNQSTR